MVFFNLRQIVGGEGHITLPTEPTVSPLPTRGSSGLFGNIVGIAVKLIGIFAKEVHRLPNDYPYKDSEWRQKDTGGWGEKILLWGTWLRSNS